MANTISLMSNVIRTVVSKKRIRYKEKGYNLDLTYIDERIIAMGYPSQDIIEGIYRNRLEDVYKFLEENHGQHYKIYNLCQERQERNYDISKFHGRVVIYPFEDHNPPTIELIQRFCKDVDLWLKENDANVVAVHCKAGKGRTGTMICAYLLYSGLKKSADEALAWYDEKRTKDRKGVTIPSQRRYVQYFSKLVCSSVPYSKISLNICEIRFSESSFLQNLGMVECSVYVLTDSATESVKPEKLITWKIDFQKSFVLTSSPSFAVAGDLKFELTLPNSTKVVCHFWLNTFFVQNSSNCVADGQVNRYTHTLSKSEIDDVHKEHKSVSEDFKISIIFEANNYCNDVQVVQAEQPSELEKNENVLNYERADYDGQPTANCFLKKKVLSAIVNENNTSKSQTIEPLLLDHKDHNIVTKIQYDTSANSKNTCSSSSASKRKQPNNCKPLSSSLNDSSTREDKRKNHMYNNQPSIKKTDLITWQNSEVHITSSSDTRTINENKNIKYNSDITCINQSSNPKFSCGTEEGEEDWESGESTYL